VYTLTPPGGTLSIMMRRFLSLAVTALAVVSVASTAHAANVRPPVSRPAVAVHTQRTDKLPSGYLSTRGSQIVSEHHQFVRIAAVGWFGQNGLDSNVPVGVDGPYVGIQANIDAMLAAGFNTVTIGWNNASLHDSNTYAYLAGIDDVVRAAGRAGLKVILNHHNDEGRAGNGNCLAQQANGLWYDRGPGTDGTDGCGTPGTVTQESFLADWKTIARRYAGNPTVIGFDLDNEPAAYPGMSTWGDGGVTDIRRMYSTVGSALEAIDPGVLIICEGPQNYNGTFTSAPGATAPEGDLTMVPSKPVVLMVDGHRVTDKTVYSVHEYPAEISGIKDDSGPAAIARYNAVWGHLVRDNIAPVWIGEAGSSMENNPDDTDWAQTLTSYINGREGAMGGPTLRFPRQGIGTTWWAWGYRPGDIPECTLTEDGALIEAQYAVYSHWRESSRPGR
jgi:aryl-phospho-beta-D-glucosidase BglC (GH1 family)